MTAPPSQPPPPAAPPGHVTVTVNGVEKHFPKGKNLLAALLDVGNYVPHYCWHPSLSIAGNCRLCLIEIEGQPRPSIACNMTCTDGLKIRTEGAMVEDCRKGMMEFLLVQHPLDCPICDRGGECMLQRYSRDYGFGTSRMNDERRRFTKPQFDPLIDIERNRCILCTRCVRFMDEVAGEHLMGIFQRGNRNYIGTFGNGPVSNVFSGNIVDLCPVGCLTSKPYRFTARPWELQQVPSTCTLCSAGCPTTTWLRDGVVYRVTPPARKNGLEFTIDEDTTKFLCNEGRYGSYYANSPQRLVKARVDGADADLPTALAAAAALVREAVAAAPDSFAILAGGRSTNEEYLALARLARDVAGTNRIDWRLDCTTASAAAALSAALSASDGDLEALERKQYKATLVLSAELLDGTPVVGLQVKEAARRRSTRLAVLDSRLDGWLSEEAEAVSIVPPERLSDAVATLAEAVGGTRDDLPPGLQKIREILQASDTGLIVVGADVAGGAILPEILPGVMALLGKLGAGWKFLPVFRARNGKGAFAAGAQSDRLPGGVLADGSGANAPGPSAPEILRLAAAGRIRTLFLHRCDELVHHPDRDLVRRALEATNVIALDVLPSWITDAAKVVLPGALWFETKGTLTSADGTLQMLDQGNQPPGEADEDWRIVTELARRVAEPAGGAVATPFALASSAVAEVGVETLFRDFQALLSPPKRFKMMDLRLDGPGDESPQRPQPAIRKKTRPDFKVRFAERPEVPPAPGAIQSAAQPAKAGEPAPLRLLWSYSIQGYDHLGERSKEFDALRPEPAIELNPEDATERGFAPDGDYARIGGAHARVCKVRVNPTLPRGVARGAANVIGLSLASAGDAETVGLPEIELAKTDPPAPSCCGGGHAHDHGDGHDHANGHSHDHAGAGCCGGDKSGDKAAAKSSEKAEVHG